MAYMDEMALEREKTRQKMLEGKSPLLGADTSSALHALGVSLGVVPPGTPPSQTAQLLQSLIQPIKGVNVKEMSPGLNVPAQVPGRQVSVRDAERSGDTTDVGGILKGLFDKARISKGSTITKSDDKTGEGRSNSVRGQNYAQPKLGEPGAPAVAEAIPGLKPGFDASKLAPGAPAAVAYMHEHAPGGAVTGVEKGVVTGGYQSDLQYLAERGGHHSKLVDGKIENVPLTDKGAYKDLDPELAARLRKTGQDYEAATGKKAVFGEFSRGEDVQRIYRDRFERGGGLAARPGQSRHQHGGAGDIPRGEFRDWADKNGAQYGVEFPHANDKVHVQIDPKYKGPSQQKPAGPAVPPMSKTPPAAAKPDTAWPAPTDTTPADQLQAQPPQGAPGPQSSLETKGTSDVTDFSARRRTPAAAAPTEVASTSPTSMVPPELLPGGQSGSGGGALAEQRAPYKAQADANPAMRETMAAIMIAEDGSPAGRQGVAEAMMNRVNARGEPFAMAMDKNYHADYMVKDPAKFQSRLAEIRNNPQLKAEVYALQDKAFAGSNVSNLATDYASGSTAANSRTNSTPTFTSQGGSQFFRKDINPNDHGPANVRNIQNWYKKTDAALKNPPAAAAPTADPKDVGSQSATMRDAVRGYLTEKGVPGSGGAGTVSTPTTSERSAKPSEVAPTPERSVFDKGAPAVPVAGVGGLQDPENEAATTGTAVYDEGAAALNAVKPPEAVAIPAPVAAAAATPAPSPAAAVVTPPPAPPPAPVAPRPPPAQAAAAAPPPVAPRPAPPPPAPVNPAHAALDMKLGDLAKGHPLGWMLPEQYAKMTLHQAVTDPQMSSTVRGYLTKENLGKYGITPQQLDQAIKDRTPGKRSDAGTSGGILDRAQGVSPELRDAVKTQYAQADTGTRSDAGGNQGKSGELEPGNLDPGSQPAAMDSEGNISTVRTMGFNFDGKETNVPSVSPDGRLLNADEAKQLYRDTGKHLGKYDTPEAAGAAAEALHQNEAKQISQHPQGQQPTITPEMMKALEGVFKDEGRVPQAPAIPPEAMPVLPTEVAPMPQPGGPPGGAGSTSGINLGGLLPPGGGLAPMIGPSQSGPIAQLGIQDATFSSPLLDSMASQPFGASSFSPAFQPLGGGFNLGGMGSGFGGFDTGGMDFGGGFDFGGGGLGSSMGMIMPISMGG